MEASDAENNFEFHKKSLKEITDSGRVPIVYISELTTNNGGKLTFSHYGKNEDGVIKAFYILD
jgi:hypothetical protein